MTQLIIANEIGYVDQSTAELLVDECDKISSMLAKLIKARRVQRYAVRSRKKRVPCNTKKLIG